MYKLDTSIFFFLFTYSVQTNLFKLIIIYKNNYIILPFTRIISIFFPSKSHEELKRDLILHLGGRKKREINEV